MSYIIKGPGIAEKLGDHLIHLLVSEMDQWWPRQWSYSWVVVEPKPKLQPSEPFWPLIFYPGASLMGMWPIQSHRASHSQWPHSWFNALLFLSWNCFWTKGPMFFILSMKIKRLTRHCEKHVFFWSISNKAWCNKAVSIVMILFIQHQDKQL